VGCLFDKATPFYYEEDNSIILYPISIWLLFKRSNAGEGGLRF
jgi:hypothetical protein